MTSTINSLMNQYSIIHHQSHKKFWQRRYIMLELTSTEMFVRARCQDDLQFSWYLNLGIKTYEVVEIACATLYYRSIGLAHLSHSWIPNQPIECHLVVTIVHYWPPSGVHTAVVMPMIALHIY